MRAKQFLRPCVMLLLAGPLTAAIAQPRLCSTVPPAEREFARTIGACRDAAPIIDVAPKAAAPGAPVVVPVPNVVGLSFDDARDQLARFKLQRSYRASGEPGGTVLAQEPAPPTRLAAGAPVRVVLSDGTLRPAPRVSESEIDGVRKPPEARAPHEAPTPQEAATPPAINATVAPRSSAEARKSPPTKATAAQRRSAAQSKSSVRRAKVEQLPTPNAAVSLDPGRPSDPSRGATGPAPATEAFELPNVIGRSSAEASDALAEFKVDRVEVVANAAPSGQVLAQDPAPGTAVASGSAIGLRVSDGSLARAAVKPPAVTPAPAAAPPPLPSPVQSNRMPVTFPSTAVLLLIAGVLLGLGLGALFMRRWLLKRQMRNDAEAVAPIRPSTLIDHSVTSIEPVSETAPPTAAAEMRFAARLDEGETKIEFTAPSDADEMTLEYSRDFHE